MRIAIDAMGGDDAPNINVEGALLAAQTWDDIELILVGNEAQIKPLLNTNIANIKVKHTEERITADDEPVRAIRRKKNASMVVAAQMVRNKEADAMISAGNTGALMAAGLLLIGRIKGVERPALAPVLPTLDGKGVLALDLGANMDAAPEHLVQYAKMGSIYRSHVHEIDKPRVGLLNIGTEANKGNELTKAAAEMLDNTPINYIGNVESRDVLHRNCDVLVCDGFAGNIMLKSMEGAADTIFKELKEIFTSNLRNKLAAAVLKSQLVSFKKKMDYREHGGALLLGINGICIKSHGSSDANAMRNAIRQARLACQTNLVQSIAKEFSGD